MTLQAGCEKIMLARENFDGRHVRGKPCLSGLFCFLTQRNQIYETDQTDQTERTDQINKTGWRTFSTSC